MLTCSSQLVISCVSHPSVLYQWGSSRGREQPSITGTITPIVFRPLHCKPVCILTFLAMVYPCNTILICTQNLQSCSSLGWKRMWDFWNFIFKCTHHTPFWDTDSLVHCSFVAWSPSSHSGVPREIFDSEVPKLKNITCARHRKQQQAAWSTAEHKRARTACIFTV